MRRVSDVIYQEPPPTAVPVLDPNVAKPTSLTDWVYEAIQTAIVSKQLGPGTVVSEAPLAAHLGVSKTPVREALLRLRMAGLLEQNGRRGLRVVLPSEALIRHAYEVRGILEAGASERAAEQATPDQRKMLQELAEQARSCADEGSAEKFRRSDRSFHLLIASSTRNPALQRLATDAYLLTCTVRDRDVPSAADIERCANEHLSIAHAILAEDRSVSGTRAREHVAGVRDMVLANFARRSTPTHG